MSQHYTTDFYEEDGWWPGRCNCGVHLGMYLTAEDAADALMEHAYAAGTQDAASRAAGHTGET